jgi:prostaglandin-endoperoxide synthase 2
VSNADAGPNPKMAAQIVVMLAARSEWLAARINAALINKAVNCARSRPQPWSTVHDYVSWTSLTDQRWSARHLPAVHVSDLPALKALKDIFARPGGEQQYCEKSTCLFPAFAQYLTDGFIRTRMPNESAGESKDLRRQNTSNHPIDLCPLYGLRPAQTEALRKKSERSGERGLLKSQLINDEEYAPFLFLGLLTTSSA